MTALNDEQMKNLRYEGILEREMENLNRRTYGYEARASSFADQYLVKRTKKLPKLKIKEEEKKKTHLFDPKELVLEDEE